MAGKAHDAIKDLARVRGEIAVTKMRLAQAEETERELLRQILDLCARERDDIPETMGVGTELAMVIGTDVAVVEFEEDWWDRPNERRHEAIDVKFVPCAPQGL